MVEINDQARKGAEGVIKGVNIIRNKKVKEDIRSGLFTIIDSMNYLVEHVETEAEAEYITTFVDTLNEVWKDALGTNNADEKIDKLCLGWKKQLDKISCDSLVDELDLEPDNGLYEEISNFLMRTRSVVYNDGRVDYDELVDVARQLQELQDGVGAVKGKRLTSEQANTLLREIEEQLESATQTIKFIHHLDDMGAISL